MNLNPDLMTFKYYPFLAAIAALITTLVQAQTQKFTPVSPEAAALAKIVNYPVNLNTGVPSITVPLYQIEARGVTLPVSLSYHAGGFKINEKSTSIGLGWSLTSDIQVTRTINGLDDFDPHGYIGNTLLNSSSSYPLFTSWPNPGGNAYDIAAGIVDGSPDKFHYKLANKSGSFYFQKNASGSGYTIVPVPFENIKISYDRGLFKIVDTDGSVYTFGYLFSGDSRIDDLPLEESLLEVTGGTYNSSWQNCSCQPKVTAWKCRKIVNGKRTDSLVFSYRKKTAIQYTDITETIEFFNNANPCNLKGYYRADQISAANPTIDTYEHLLLLYPFYNLSSPRYIEHFGDRLGMLHLPYLNAQNTLSDKTYSVSGQSPGSVSSVFGLAVSKITFNNGSVEFEGSDQVNSLIISDHEGTIKKTINFYQSYATAGNMEKARSIHANGMNFKGTLYLDSLEIKAGGRLFEKYKFVYKEKFCFGDHLKGKDAWGGANALTRERYLSENNLAVPFLSFKQRVYKNIDYGCGNYVDNVTVNVGNSDNKEFPALDPAQRGILDKIIYPTGGYVDFDFESNKYKIQSSNYWQIEPVRMAGGLRVRTITYYDGRSRQAASQKYYRYGELEDGIGLLNNWPQRNFDDLKFDYLPFSYSQKIAYVTGPGTANFGTDFAPISMDCCNRSCMSVRHVETKTTYLPASSVSYTYPDGAPIYYTKVTEYNSDGGVKTGKKVHGFYDPLAFQPYSFLFTSKIPGTNLSILQSEGLMGVQKYLEEYKYDNNKYSLVHSKEFIYEKYLRPQPVKVVYSCFAIVYQVISNQPIGCQPNLYDASMAFQWTTPEYPTSVQNQYISGEYDIQVGKLLLKEEKDRWLDSDNLLAQSTKYHYDNPEYPQVSRIETSNSMGESVTKYFTYSYDYSSVPVYAEMKANNRVTELIEERIFNNTLNKEISRLRTNYGQISSGKGFIAPVSIEKYVDGNPPQTLMTYELYDGNGNVLQMREKGSLVKSYLWGYGSRYLIAEIAGAPYSSITSAIDLATLPQHASDVIQLRSALSSLRTLLPTAQVSIFTHRPLTGLLSQTSPSGSNTYYEYDLYGRLNVIRDHDNSVLKKYDYNMAGNNDPGVLIPTEVSYPIMKTFSKACPDGTGRPYNYTEPGGLFNGTYNIRGSVEYRLESNGSQQSVPYDCYGGPVYATVSVGGYYTPGLPAPQNLYIDLLQNGSIVATMKFTDLNNRNKVYIPAGNYQISFRIEDNFNNSTLKFFILGTEGTSAWVKSGATFNAVPGAVYNIDVLNSI